MTIAGAIAGALLSRRSIEGVELHGFISDVRPYYAAANVVVVPTQVSAGTNLKVLESLACERAVVSTSSGCPASGLEDGKNVWIADDPEAFRDAIETSSPVATLSQTSCGQGRIFVRKRHTIGNVSPGCRAASWKEAAGNGVRVRTDRSDRSPAIRRIQMSSHTASHWEPETYFDFDVTIAECKGRPAGSRSAGTSRAKLKS